jgi:hypothetical protein
MGIVSQQGINYQLVANGEILDLFNDEDIKLSDNVTGLFDLGIVPADFTRQFTLPGTKKNNAFFEHVYDISVLSPDIWATNQKVSCYLDFGGIYIAQGYLQLNKVNVLANKFIDSYEVSLYGAVSSFAREVNRTYLTDMTSSLAQFNHKASINNITASWGGGLFGGAIVYPMAEYGQKIIYSPESALTGIDAPSGSLFVQDYKPAIRIKEVWDAIFEQYGFTYTGSFWQYPFLDNVYMVCNNSLRYPIFAEENLENYGQIRIGPISGSTDGQLTNAASSYLPWYNITNNPDDNINSDLVYGLEYPSKLRGVINLNVKLSNTLTSSLAGTPKFFLQIYDLSNTKIDNIPLVAINEYFINLQSGWNSQGLPTPTQKYTVTDEWNSTYLPSGSYKFAIEYQAVSYNSFDVILDPDGELKSFLEVNKVGNLGEGWNMNIGANMPFGTNGIKQIDFITAIQKKFNLVIYPSKNRQREFVVETFNNWYNKGTLWNFDNYINLDEKIEVIPANNLAVNELNFGDTLDNDYISQQFSKEANREYGKTYYVDNQNFFSQGKFEVKTNFASSPLIYLDGTGVSGSQSTAVTNKVSVSDELYDTYQLDCLGTSYPADTRLTIATYTDASGNPATNFGAPVNVIVNYNYQPCFGGSFTSEITIVIPFGASSANYFYDSSRIVDCGQSNCVQETQTIDCVSSVSGQSGISLYSGSPIAAC